MLSFPAPAPYHSSAAISVGRAGVPLIGVNPPHERHVSPIAVARIPALSEIKAGIARDR
jgi:hypothetical protein